MERTKFIGAGDTESRHQTITALDSYLKSTNTSPDFKRVLGSYCIGKTRVIEYAILKLREKEKFVMMINHNKSDHFEYRTHAERSASDDNDTHTEKLPTRIDRDTDGKDTQIFLKTVEDKIKKCALKFKKHIKGLDFKEVPFLICHVDTKGDTEPEQLWDILNRCGDGYKIKLIVERHKDHDIQTQSYAERQEVRKPFLPRHSIEDLTVPAFKNKEVDTFISQSLDQVLQSNDDLSSKLVEIIRFWCGRHPGLLGLICDLVRDNHDIINYADYNEKGTLESCIEKQVLKPKEHRCRDEVHKVVNSLPDPARSALKKELSHFDPDEHGWDLERNGLLIDDENQKLKRKIGLLDRFSPFCRKGEEEEKSKVEDDYGNENTATKPRGEEMNNIKVFISYSHDSPEHANRVLSLADRLVEDGIDCIIDQYEDSPADGWNIWMDEQIKCADFVLMICTETYYKRVMREEETGKGLGAKWEGKLIYQHIFKADSKNTRFIPVVFASDQLKYIPTPLQDATYYSINTAEGYDKLYRRLTNQPETPRPHPGNRRSLPSRERRQNFFD